MADRNLTVREAEEEFWNHLEKSNTGMLGLDQPGYHSQPMTAFREEETGTIWFFTRDDTDLARDAALPGGQSAMFHYGSKDQTVWACIHGDLSVHGQDREIVDRFCIIGPVEEHIRRLEELKALGVTADYIAGFQRPAEDVEGHGEDGVRHDDEQDGGDDRWEGSGDRRDREGDGAQEQRVGGNPFPLDGGRIRSLAPQALGGVGWG